MNYWVRSWGSDGGTGSEADPLRTPQRAADLSRPGDIAWIGNGRFPGFVVTQNGAPGSPITFKAVAGELPIIDGSLGHSQAYYTITLNLDRRAYIVIDGLEIDGARQIQQGIQAEYAEFITILKCKAVQARGTGLAIYRSHDVTVEDTVITDNSTGNWPRGSYSDWAAGLLAGADSYNIVLRRVKSFWNHGEGLTFGAHAHECLMEGCEVFNNWSTNIYVTASQNVTVRNNLAYNTDEAINWPSGSPNMNNPPGIAIGSGDDSQGFSGPDVLLTGLKILYNRIGNTQGGITRFHGTVGVLQPDSDWLIEGNQILRCWGGISLKQALSFSRFIIRNNVINGDLKTSYDQSFIAIDPPLLDSVIESNQYNSTTRHQWQWGGQKVGSLAEWSALSGDRNSTATSYPVPVFDPVVPSPSPVPIPVPEPTPPIPPPKPPFHRRRWNRRTEDQ